MEKKRGSKKKEIIISLRLTLNLFSEFCWSSRCYRKRGLGFTFLHSFLLRGWGPGLGPTIHSFLASSPGLPRSCQAQSSHSAVHSVIQSPAWSPRQGGRTVPLYYCLCAGSARAAWHRVPLRHSLWVHACLARQVGCKVQLGYCLWACSARLAGCTVPLCHSLWA